MYLKCIVGFEVFFSNHSSFGPFSYLSVYIALTSEMHLTLGSVSPITIFCSGVCFTAWLLPKQFHVPVFSPG